MPRDVYPDAIVSCGQSGENTRRIIGRAIIESKQFEVVEATRLAGPRLETATTAAGSAQRDLSDPRVAQL